MTGDRYERQFLAYGRQVEKAKRVELERVRHAQEGESGTGLSDRPLQLVRPAPPTQNQLTEEEELQELMKYDFSNAKPSDDEEQLVEPKPKSDIAAPMDVVTGVEQESWNDTDRRANDPALGLRERVQAQFERSAIEKALEKRRRDAARTAMRTTEPTAEPATTTSVQHEPAANDSTVEAGHVDDELAGMLSDAPATPTATGSTTSSVPLVTRIENLTDKDKQWAQRVERERWADLRPPAGEQFTKLPWTVFRSDQFAALGPRTQLLLIQVAHCEFGSGGFIPLTRAKLQRWGFHSHTRGNAIKEAIETGFLRVTRSESKLGRKATCYFPTWIAMKGERVAPNNWAQLSPKSSSKVEPSAVRKAA